MRRIIQIGAATALLALAASPVFAHEATVDVVCPYEGYAGGILVEGFLFTGNPPDSEPIHSPVTLTGPDGYLETLEVTTAEWATEFPLGPNGAYHLDWPEAGAFAQDFTVECTVVEESPSPTPRPTPTTGVPPTPTVPPTHKPHITPPPTDTLSTETADGSPTLVVSLFVLSAAAGLALVRRLSPR